MMMMINWKSLQEAAVDTRSQEEH